MPTDDFHKWQPCLRPMTVGKWGLQTETYRHSQLPARNGGHSVTLVRETFPLVMQLRSTGNVSHEFTVQAWHLSAAGGRRSHRPRRPHAPQPPLTTSAKPTPTRLRAFSSVSNVPSVMALGGMGWISTPNCSEAMTTRTPNASTSPTSVSMATVTTTARQRSNWVELGSPSTPKAMAPTTTGVSAMVEAQAVPGMRPQAAPTGSLGSASCQKHGTL